MSDIGQTIAPNSTQTNADDLLTGPRTITITRVSADATIKEQPVSIFFEGDEGRPWKPCKQMRRVLVSAWGDESAKYIGRQVTLFCDPNVVFGGIKVGGIRISHMSHIDADMTISLTVTRSKRAPYQVRRLDTPQSAKAAQEAKPDPGEIESLMKRGEEIAQAGVMSDLAEWWQKDLTREQRKAIGDDNRDRWKAIAETKSEFEKTFGQGEVR